MKLRNLVVLVLLTALFLNITGTAPAFAGKGQKNPMVYVKTNLGSFTIELYPDKAPLTVENFMHYVDHKFYNGLIFHRVMDGFMIQGGGFNPDMVQKSPSPPIKNEATNGLKNLKYTIAMARTGVVDSATSQFFINVKDNTALDNKGTAQSEFGYCVFGKVIEGMEVIDKIKAVKTTKKGSYSDVPVKPVIIKSISKLEAEEE